MNKNEFIQKLLNETNYDKDKCIIINNIIEKTFIIGKKNKGKIIGNFENSLNISNEEANILYETIMDILGSQIKEKLKHPFKGKD